MSEGSTEQMGEGPIGGVQCRPVGRRQFWAAVSLLFLPPLCALGALFVVIEMAAASITGARPQTGPLGSIRPGMTLALAITVLLVYAASHRRLYRLFRSLLRHRTTAIWIQPPLPDEGRFLLGFFANLFVFSGVVVFYRFMHAPPRTELLAMALWFVSYHALKFTVCKIAKMPDRSDPLLLACAAAAAAYAFAVYRGVPAPTLLLAPDAGLVRPFGLLMLVCVTWTIGGGICGLFQFHCLLRLKAAASPGQGGGEQGPSHAAQR